MTNWWQYPTSLLYGQKEANGGVENGVDFQTPFHTPITVIPGLGGIITAINKDAWGGTITIQTNQSLGTSLGVLPTYTYYTHLDEFASGLQKGSIVNPGDLLGLSGGQVTGGSMPSGSYSTGPHIEFGFTNGPAFGHGSAFQTGPTVLEQLNPIPYINSAMGLNIPVSPPGSVGQIGSVTNQIGPAISNGITQALVNAFKSIFSADIVQRGIIVILALILIVVGVVVLFKGGTSVVKSEVAS